MVLILMGQPLYQHETREGLEKSWFTAVGNIQEDYGTYQSLFVCCARINIVYPPFQVDLLIVWGLYIAKSPPTISYLTEGVRI